MPEYRCVGKCQYAAPDAEAIMAPAPDADRKQFESWWAASKYCQVAYDTAGNEQIAWDGWQAAAVRQRFQRFQRRALANDPVTLARLFHDTYERLAPEYGYVTRDDTQEFDPASPNGRLMTRVCAEISNAIFCPVPAAPAPDTADSIMALAYRLMSGSVLQSDIDALRSAVERVIAEGDEDRERVIAAEKGWNDDVIELTERAERAEQEAAALRKVLKDFRVDLVTGMAIVRGEWIAHIDAALEGK